MSRLLAFAAALLLAAPAFADVKIGYFDVKRILTEVEEAKVAKSTLQKDFEKKQKALDARREEIEKLEKEFKAKAAVMSDTAKQQMAMEMQTKVVEAQKLYVELQQELAGKEQQALADLLSRLEPVVRELAEAEGYTYVLEKNEAGLFYAPAGHDLTAQLIRRYNTKFPPKKAGGK